MSKDSKKSKVESLLNQIRKHLWRGQVHGRAAVMIGSGFSRNASPIKPESPPFPLWGDLTKGFLHDLCLDSDEVRGHDPLHLASRLEARFGRTALDRRLQELIPYLEYKPGDLHTRLLNLPWSDVFTTNYDTLLERTRPNLEPKRHYTVLNTQDSVAGSSQPRIVKLHGSFPDHFPLIITEEDYRRYPVDHALFVNTVQQSMMENAFLLLGFSGDDPNFLRWSGWIRDNLKDRAPKIYLCGLFKDLDESQVALLEQRNIAVVDLEALLEDGSSDVAHEDAIAKLLDYLEEGKPEDFTQWPYDSELARRGVRSTPEVSLSEDVPILRQGRAEYPGWIVCPQKIRDRLWERSLKPRLQKLEADDFWDGVGLDERLAYLRELVWRLERCLYPLIEPLSTEVENAVNEFFKTYGNSNGARSEETCTTATCTTLKCTENVVELLMALFRHAREEMDQERFEQYWRLLEKLNLKEADLLLRIHYEKCLWAWYQLNFEGLGILLKDWPAEQAAPFWETKRASLLLVVGQYDDAWRILEDTLSKLRSRLHEESDNIRLLSQESWTMCLLHLRHDSSAKHEKDLRRARLGRWRELEPYLCYPFSEIDAVGQSTRVSIESLISEKSGFDPGKKTVSHRMGSTDRLNKYLSHHALQRFHEESAFQIRLGPYANSKDHLPDVLQVLLEDNPTRAFSLGVRFHSKELTELFSRLSIARIPEDEVAPIFGWLSETCANAVKKLSLEPYSDYAPPPWDGVVSTALELLSRLLLRLGEGELSTALDMACQLYRHPIVRVKHRLNDSVRNLFKRTLFAMSTDKISEQLPMLLALPLGNADGTPISLLSSWPEPFDFIELPKRIEDPNQTTEAEGRLDRVPFLIEQLHGGTAVHRGNRQRALSRLRVLLEMGILSREQEEEFASAVWAGVPEEDQELPKLDGYYPNILLHLPECDPGEGTRRLQSWLLNIDLTELGGHFDPKGKKKYPPAFLSEVELPVQTWNHATIPRWCEIPEEPRERRLEWSAEQASTNIGSAIELWNNQKRELEYWQKNPMPFPGQLEAFFLNLSTMISKTLIPYLGVETIDLYSVIEETMLDMLNNNIPVQRNLHMLLWLDQKKVDLVFKATVAGMHSKDHLISGHSYVGVRDWALMAQRLKKPEIGVPEVVRRSLLAMVLTRDTPAYDTLIQVNGSIVKELPDFYSVNDKDFLCQALGALLNQSSISVEGQEPEAEGAATDDLDSFLSASQLAAALFEDCEMRAAETPEILQRWRELTINIRLPELRKAWIPSS